MALHLLPIILASLWTTVSAETMIQASIVSTSSDCTAHIQQAAFTKDTFCTHSDEASECTKDKNGNYHAQMCISALDGDETGLAVAKEKMGSDTPLVMLSMYPTSELRNFTSAVAFVADGGCLITDYGASSIRVTLPTAGEGDVKIETYDGTKCEGTPRSTAESPAYENNELKLVLAVNNPSTGSDGASHASASFVLLLATLLAYI